MIDLKTPLSGKTVYWIHEHKVLKSAILTDAKYGDAPSTWNLRQGFNTTKDSFLSDYKLQQSCFLDKEEALVALKEDYHKFQIQRLNDLQVALSNVVERLTNIDSKVFEVESE